MKGLYTVYDTVADECGPISIYNNDEQAQRAYPLAFKDMQVNPQDFQLLRIGVIQTDLKKVEAGLNMVDGIPPVDITPFIGKKE